MDFVEELRASGHRNNMYVYFGGITVYVYYDNALYGEGYSRRYGVEVFQRLVDEIVRLSPLPVWQIEGGR